MDVGEIGDLLESEEGDAERQDDVEERPIGARAGIEARDEEIGVFEIGEDAEIPDEAENEKRLAPRTVLACHRMRIPPVHQHRDDEEDEETRAPPGVEGHGSEEQPRHAKLPAPGDAQEVEAE